ncbi:hypothetical protein U9M48_009865 [Paspalum notatum var. saurae]|uniref:Uncharacterized protein n=1 Tax=Paspalum notatum var. saurae TaxID=547442 RepID=A0AAQ3SSP8_PASNO
MAYGSLAGDEVGGVGPGVVGDGVGDVVEEVLNGSLAGDDGLHEEPKHGEHGEASVLELLDLELGGGVRVVGEAQRVEGAAGVDLVEALAERAAADAVALDEAHEHDLAGPDGEDALRVHQVGVAQVVQPALGEDLRAGLEPHRLAELDAVLGQDLREHAAQRAQHRPPRVDHLQLAVARERLRVGGEPRRVPAVVAGELAGQVRRRLLGEGAQMLWGALLTVRRMVMRPPASTPAGRETRAWPRNPVVWCSADAAIFDQLLRFLSPAMLLLADRSSGGMGMTGTMDADLYTAGDWRAARRLVVVDARRATSAPRPLAAAAPLDIARRDAQ